MKLSMKVGLIICLGMMVSMVMSMANDPLSDEHWQSWKMDNGKKYKDLTEETMRYKIWKNCTMHTDPTNNSTMYAKSCDYPFADWTQEEIDAKLKGNRPNKAAAKKYAPMDKLLSLGASSLPQSLDYRQTNLVTYVKNQGSCGSCWAFAASQALEGQLAKKTGQQVVLSVQQFLDCDRYDYACNGGSVGDAFYYLTKTGGLESAVSYPYTSGRTLKAGTCAYNQQQVQVSVSDYSYVQNFNDNALMQALSSVGPIAVNVCANSNFQYYQSGIFSDNPCSQSTADHAVLLVGYNSASQYWIVKNSWGTNWGQSGYIYMAMGKNLLVDPVYPIVN